MLDTSSITGIATVTTINSHGFNVGDEVTLSNIVFNCGDYSSSITTSIFPDPQRSFIVDSIVDNVGTSKTFTIDAGIVNIPHTYVPAQHQFVSATSNAITNTTSGTVQFTPTAATYDGATGICTFGFAANHNLSTSNTIQIANDSLSFRCSMDRYLSVHTYPRATDPVSGISINIISKTDDDNYCKCGCLSSGGNVGPLQMELIMSILENSTT